ncbi:medium-chain acyl-CoA ligase ACSF2, mitochondrial-like [Saccostrea echinata]|uniref:medium-chain acyl-CoA ligase ACSF2, mitochondrial-like n=1 Tax=Saccostrea echinata TaxID=191078 RepID=UPI002A8320F1|nr:medium-chain acyl-CoA ligase ACSF2, mitochondrial-like [Saccostrea echinata]
MRAIVDLFTKQVLKNLAFSLVRDCSPAGRLTKSYFHGACRVPLSGETIGEVLLHKEIDPDKVIFAAPEFNQKLTVKELRKESILFSKWLIKNGIQKGDIVLVNGVADLKYFPLLLGTVSIGCICQTINPTVIIMGFQSGKEELLIAENLKTRDNADRATCLKQIRFLGESNIQDYFQDDNSVTDESYFATMKSVSPEDPAFIIRTTGSTGSSKAVLTCHKSVVNFGIFCVDRHERKKMVTNEINIAVPNPVTDDIQPVLHTLNALINWKTSKIVLNPSWLDFGCEDMERFAKFLQEEKITCYLGYPYEVIKLVNSEYADQYDLSNLKSVNLVSQIVSKEMRETIYKHFPNSAVCYGASECLVGTCTSPILSSPEQRLYTVGYPFPHTEVKIIGDKHEILPINVPGEICIKGFGIFYGYLNNNEPGTGPLDKQGWLRTGDVGKMDETGHVTYIGRKTDCLFFKHGGDKIYPTQLTDIISSHPDVLESAVLGIQSDEKGDDIFIFYVLREGSTATPGNLREYMLLSVHETMCADFFIPVQSLPRTGSRHKR